MSASLFEFVWLPMFERTSKKRLSDDDRRSIETTLCENVYAGDLIKRTGGFRKLRYGTEGRGKRGGFRVIYYPDEECGRVYMILVYAKGEIESLSRREENQLRALATALLEGDC